MAFVNAEEKYWVTDEKAYGRLADEVVKALQREIAKLDDSLL